jgi:feruloyl esterase
MYTCRHLFFVAIAVCTLVTSATRTFRNCSSLAQSTSLGAYNASLLNTTYYATGALNVSGSLNSISFCEIYASVSYGTNDSLIFALWLPDTHYSSRFMAIGNGGQAGVITYGDMMEELNSELGFAVAGGNAGHLASDNDVGAGPSIGAPGIFQPYLHDENQVKAWLHNAISLFTPVAKALIKDFYGYEAKYAYYRGCSAGGAQGFSLAEFHPGLFDGIISGCPANWFTHLMLSFLWNAQHTNVRSSSWFTLPLTHQATQTNATFLPQSVLNLIQSKVFQECDMIDGVADNLIENPLTCAFDISSLACNAGAPTKDAICLTPSQISTVKAIYQGPTRMNSPRTSLFPGLSLGSEAGWFLPQVQGALSNAFSVPILQNLVYQNLSYDAATFNWGSDVDFLQARAGPLIDSVKTNLSSFRNGGGKMIVYAGWADPNIAPMWSIRHVEAVTQDTIGHGTTISENDFVKLVMVPGGGHCGANIADYPYVPAHYDFSSALVEWVEKGREPVKGIRSWGPTNGEDRTRKLCTWPQVAKLRKNKDADDWKSYRCG